MQLIHQNTMRAMFRSGEALKVKFWNSNGDIVVADNVICTSSFYQGNTVNFKFLNSGQFRKVKVISIFEVNDCEVFL